MYDIVVVGGGPAGLTAGLYAARTGKSVLVLEGETTGGQINNAPMVENYPGMPGVSGARYAEILTEQVKAQGICIQEGNVLALRRKGLLTEAVTAQSVYSGAAVILATGVTHRKLGVPGEDALTGNGVSYCAVCDGAFYKGRTIAVVGGGNTAFQETLFLSSVCKKVMLIHRRDSFRCDKSLEDLVLKLNNVTFLLNYEVSGLLHDECGLTGIILRSTVSGERRELAVDGLFVAIGYEPKKQLSQIDGAVIETDKDGFYVTDVRCATNVPGIYAAGDCRAKTARQLVTATGDGAVAALVACAYVDSRTGCDG